MNCFTLTKKKHKRSRIRRAIRRALMLLSPVDHPFLVLMQPQHVVYEWPIDEGVTEIRGL